MADRPIIIGRGPRLWGQPDAIVIDYASRTIWDRTTPHRLQRAGGGSNGRICFRVMAAILSAGTGLLTYDRLMEAVWGDSPSGGPLNWRNYVSTICSWWRANLIAMGVTVNAAHGRGLWITHGDPEEMAEMRATYEKMRSKATEAWRLKKRRYGPSGRRLRDIQPATMEAL